MNNKKKNLFNVLKILLVAIILWAALKFENANNMRLIILIGTSLLYIVVGIIRSYFIKRSSVYPLLFLFDVTIVFLLEYNSKYMINYFLHSLYLLILLEAALMLNRKKGIIIGIITVAASLVKYLILIYYKSNFSNISQMAFFTLINVFVLVTINFAQYHKEEKEKKEELYTELLSTHKSLKEYSEKNKKLMIVEERNRIARDIHDTLGHNMTAFIMELEIISRLIDTDAKNAKEMMKKIKQSAREGLVQIREILEALEPNEKLVLGVQSIKELADEFSNRTGVKIQFKTKGDIVKTSPIINISLYRVVQEALTNAIRHGAANIIDIDIEYKAGSIDFRIANNGKCHPIASEGLGIKGMKERIYSLNGEIQFVVDEVFTIKGFIPLEVDKNDKSSNS
ncbi:sensor histidine kinase [Brassicibacter mesophilus]|uniref:sensor histidine kinase n=1 Tax=Brassicibacter mesophilus TaxID=745119 RepID=UPI003D2423CB